MLECARSVSRHTHSMEWSACSSIHSTPRNGVCHTPKMHSEWNGMECRSRSVTSHSAQDWLFFPQKLLFNRKFSFSFAEAKD